MKKKICIIIIIIFFLQSSMPVLLELAPVRHLPVRWKRLQSDVTDVVGRRTKRQTQTEAACWDLTRLCSPWDATWEACRHSRYCPVTMTVLCCQLPPRLAIGYLSLVAPVAYLHETLPFTYKTNQTKKKVHSLSISTVPFHLFQMHVCLRACMDSCTSTGEQHCVAQLSLFFTLLSWLVK